MKIYSIKSNHNFYRTNNKLIAFKGDAEKISINQNKDVTQLANDSKTQANENFSGKNPMSGKKPVKLSWFEKFMEYWIDSKFHKPFSDRFPLDPLYNEEGLILTHTYLY